MKTDVHPPAFHGLDHRQVRLIVFGVLLPTFLGSLDNTIVASALPTIGRELGDADYVSWIITISLLTSTAITPLYGKISDIHGRRITLLCALGVYLIGSLCCALASSMLGLILARGLQGLGSGGLTSLGQIVLGDVAAPKLRARYYTYFAIVYTTSGAIGPALGGVIAQYLHWSDIFWLNIPLGLIAFTIVFFVLKKLPRHERPHRLDVLGALLIIAASATLLLVLNLGGGRYPWSSAPVLALAGTAIILIGLFVARLLTAAEPLIPLGVLSDPVVCLAALGNAAGWGGIIGLNIFLPVYLQGALGFSVANSGLALVIFMVAVNVAAGIGSTIIGHAEHYKRVPLMGLLLAIGATLVLAWRADQIGFFELELILALIGFGFGPLAPLTAVSLQNAVELHQLGTATATMGFFRNLWGATTVAILGTILLATAPAVSHIRPHVEAAPVQASYAGAFTIIFLAIAASLFIAFLSILAMEERPLIDRR
jgi:EmrB/QacA subfamily drug resistance transporter